MKKETLKQLKQAFYAQDFRHFMNYLASKDFSNVNLGINKALDIALTDRNGNRYYSDFFAKNNYLASKGIYLKHDIKKITEHQAWASVEEFFDILDDEAVNELNELDTYLVGLFDYIQNDEPKNSDETKQKSEDTIIRLIVKHFWSETPERYKEGVFRFRNYCPEDGTMIYIETDKDGNEQELQIKYLSTDGELTDERVANVQSFIERPYEIANTILNKTTFFNLINITEKRLIDESLDDNYKQVINYLKAVKQIRNNQAHNIGNTVNNGASSVFQFCIFVYMHLVLTLRQSLIRRGKEEYQPNDKAEFFVEIEKPSPTLYIKLLRISDNGIFEEIQPVKTEDSKLFFYVDYYVKYKLVVSDKQEKDTMFIYNSISPHAIIPNLGEPVIRHGDEDSTPERRVLFADLLKQIGNLKDEIGENTDALRQNTDATKSNTEATKKVAQVAGDAAEAASKAAEAASKAAKVATETVEAARKKAVEEAEEAKRKAEEEEEAKRIAEEARKKAEEEAAERKRRCLLRIFSGIIGILLMATIGVFVWCYVTDNSLIWIKHKSSILCVTSLVALLLVVAVVGFYRLSKSKKIKKLLVPIGVLLLFAIFIKGAYYSIPHKVARAFIENYEFSIHDKSDNTNAVDYFTKCLGDDIVCDIATSKLIDYFINYEKDSINLNKAIELSDRVVGDISKYPKSSTYAAYAYFAKAGFGTDKKLYAPINFIFDNNKTLSTELTCLKGIMTVYGLGVDKDVKKGIAMLQESANLGNSKAQYYLGFVYSRDLTDWDAYRKGKNKLPFNNINLYWAIIYLQTAADKRPEAMLELANIYNDLNLTDRALLCYHKAIERANGVVLKSANFKMGLLQERLGNKDNKYLTDAISSAYAPAIIHKAEQDKDYVKQIGYYLTSTLPQYRYIPPIVFCYLNEAEFDNALKVLQTYHKNGGFDMNFIHGMRYLLGATVEQDSIKGYEYMEKSAGNGCVFANMICDFRKYEKSGKFQFSNFNEYCDEIPFAYILRSWLLAREGRMGQAQLEAMKAISLKHPAGAYMLSFTENRDTIHFAKWDMAFRALPSNVNKQDCVYFDYYYNTIKNSFNEQPGIPLPELEFWAEVAIANHCFDVEMMILDYLFRTYGKEDVFFRPYIKLLEAALVDATGVNESYTFRLLSYLINGISGFYEEMKTKYLYNINIQSILSVSPTIYNDEVTPKTNKIERIPFERIYKMNNSMPQHLTDWQILTELSNMGNEYIDYYPM